MRFVNEEDLARWEIGFEELFEVGLERLLSSTSLSFQLDDSGYFKGLWQDDYDSSRILLPELFKKLGLDGEPVFVIPNRLTLMVAGSNDEDAIAAMLQKAEEIIQAEARAQNLSLLTYQQGVLRDFRVAPSSKLHPQVARAQKLAAHSYYAEQAEKLSKVHEKYGKDYFIATYQLTEVEPGKLLSFCVWSKDIPSLLPQTDRVFFFDPETKATKSATFSDALRVAGDIMLDTQMFPVRYFVSGFPTEAQFEQIGAEAM